MYHSSPDSLSTMRTLLSASAGFTCHKSASRILFEWSWPERTIIICTFWTFKIRRGEIIQNLHAVNYNNKGSWAEYFFWILSYCQCQLLLVVIFYEQIIAGRWNKYVLKVIMSHSFFRFDTLKIMIACFGLSGQITIFICIIQSKYFLQSPFTEPIANRSRAIQWWHN